MSSNQNQTPYLNDHRDQGRPKNAVTYARYKNLEKEFCRQIGELREENEQLKNKLNQINKLPNAQ